MPIIRISAQEQEGVLIPSKIDSMQDLGTLAIHMINQGCRPVICEPNSHEDITPPYWRTVLYRYLLRVATSGEEATVDLMQQDPLAATTEYTAKKIREVVRPSYNIPNDTPALPITRMSSDNPGRLVVHELIAHI